MRGPEQYKVGLDPKPATDSLPLKSCIEWKPWPAALKPPGAGHEPRTMRLVGPRRRPSSESPSWDDGSLACSVASISEFFRPVSVGLFHKAIRAAVR